MKEREKSCRANTKSPSKTLIKSCWAAAGTRVVFNIGSQEVVCVHKFCLQPSHVAWKPRWINDVQTRSARRVRKKKTNRDANICSGNEATSLEFCVVCRCYYLTARWLCNFAEIPFAADVNHREADFVRLRWIEILAKLDKFKLIKLF